MSQTINFLTSGVLLSYMTYDIVFNRFHTIPFESDINYIRYFIGHGFNGRDLTNYHLQKYRY